MNKYMIKKIKTVYIRIYVNIDITLYLIIKLLHLYVLELTLQYD